ncbi:uncharacterized protein (TIGR01244 family) [Aminobacter aganoensis]|uniref:Uncharacterized protein (TIGR01244 family) n=1 Tax=Aminobacter aganoensis TaxID=83264 RepID=A0A7X0CE55_9HYPH|nr:uncharacterized protein (TIGR01244 family) [Aminobacter aganoensis]
MIKVTDKLWVSGQPTDADVIAAGEAGIRKVINNRPEHEDPTQPSMAEAAERAARAGMDFVNIPVAPGRYTLEAVRAFQKAVAEAQGPVFAHCKGGTRSATLWAIGEVLDNRMSVDELDAVGQRLGINFAGAKDWLRSNS